jgi:hypothetical protein
MAHIQAFNYKDIYFREAVKALVNKQRLLVNEQPDNGNRHVHMIKEFERTIRTMDRMNFAIDLFRSFVYVKVDSID